MDTPITYIKDFLPDPVERFEDLKKIGWIRHDKVPRSEYYCNVYDKQYAYGMSPFTRTYDPQPWTDTIMMIKDRLEAYVGSMFDVCFLNRYHDQSDQLGWHADDSPEMDDNRPIAIISLGVEREIWFREKSHDFLKTGFKNDSLQVISTPEVTKLKLENGSLCLMHAGMQDTHQHRIPKASFICGERISLTFRGYYGENE